MKALPRAALVSSPSPVDPSALPPEGEAYEHDHGCLVVGSMYCMYVILRSSGLVGMPAHICYEVYF